MNYRAQLQPCLRKLVDYQFSPNQMIVAQRIIELSFGHDRRGVILLQQDLEDITDLDESALSRAISSLKSKGVLQVIGPRYGTKEYRWLPNGELLAPDPRIDSAKAKAAYRRIAELNRFGSDDVEPGNIFQRALGIRTEDELLADEFATASLESSVGDAGPIHPLRPVSGERWHDPQWVAEMTRRSLLGLPETSESAFFDAPLDDPSGDGREVTSQACSDLAIPDVFLQPSNCENRNSPDRDDGSGRVLAPVELRKSQFAHSSEVPTTVRTYAPASGPGTPDSRSTGTRSPGASVAVANDDLLQGIRAFIGDEEWSGKGRLSRLWINAVKMKPWSRRAALTALSEMKLAKNNGFRPNKTWGRCLWGTFQRIESEFAPEN